MAHSSHTIGQCSICYSPDEQTKVVLQGIAFSLRSVDEIPLESANDFGGFSRLINVIFRSKFKAFKNTIKCSHSDIKGTFVMSLKISEEELDKKSNFKILEMGKYNFQTDVVSMQIKSFPRHFTDISKATVSKKKQRKSPQGTSSEYKLSHPSKNEANKSTQRTYTVKKQNVEHDEIRQVCEPIVVKTQQFYPTYFNGSSHFNSYSLIPSMPTQNQYNNYVTQMMEYGLFPNTFSNNRPS